ncbi:hypothetical protein [Microbacterium sp. KR10-403]|uniref:hypothetical protein n=1 Tax=Microbacterium sp. KR10-403 TaxID=3158581 RepID=UPI0032E40D3C
MSTEILPDQGTRIDRRRDAETTVVEYADFPTDGIHGVHVECQRYAPFKTTWCGIAVEDSGYAGDSADASATACPACDAAKKCPVCGVVMLYTVTELLRA